MSVLNYKVTEWISTIFGIGCSTTKRLGLIKFWFLMVQYNLYFT